MKKTTLLLMLITIVSQIFGFARDITLSYFYGISGISDAYLISITITMVIFSLIGAGITTGYIPMYNKIEETTGTMVANRFTSNLINIVLLLCTLIIVLGIIFTKNIVMIFATGFEGDTLELSVKLTQIGLFGIYFTALIFIFNGFLQMKQKFALPALMAIPMNLIIIFSIYLSTIVSEFFLAIGSVLAPLFACIILVFFINKLSYKHKIILDIKDKHIKRFAYLALPIIIGVSVNQINVLVDKTLASQIVVGGVSALHYANKLNLFVQGLFVFSIVTTMFPVISKLNFKNNTVEFKKTVSESISSVSILIVPVMIGSMVFAEPVVELLFGRGAFDQRAVKLTSTALFFYSIGMLGFGLREVLSRTFYSLQDTKTPMVNAAIAVVINIILNIILSRYLGIGGLALATSISGIICTVLLFISLRKKIGPFGMKKITISFMKIIVASLVMGVIAKFIFDYLTSIINQNLSLLISIVIGAISYFAIIYFMKIDEVDVIFNAVKRKFSRV